MEPAPRPVRRGLLAAALAAAALLGYSGLTLVESYRLQLRLDRAESLRHLRAAARETLAQAQPTAALLRRQVGAGGVRYAVLRDPSGRPLATAGAYDRLRLPLISAGAAQQLRQALYWLTADGASEAVHVTTPRGSVDGRLDYGLSRTIQGAVREEALDRLARFALWGTVLGLAGFAAALYALWRRLPAASWRERLARPKASAAAPPGFSAEWPEALNAGWVVLDAAQTVVQLNSTAARLTGWSPENAKNQRLHSVLHGGDAEGEAVLRRLEQALLAGAGFAPAECSLRSRDGRVRWVEISAAPSVGAAVVLVRDARAVRAEREALRTASRLPLGLMDRLADGVLHVDAHGIIRYANAAVYRLFGYRTGELDGAGLGKLLPVPFLSSAAPTLADYTEPRREGLPAVTAWRKDAATFPVELTVIAMDGGWAVMLRAGATHSSSNP